MKSKLNKKIPTPDLIRILILLVYSIVLFAATFATWYYFAVTIPAQEIDARNKKMEIINEMYKAKYCNKLPYESAAVKRLCTQNPFLLTYQMLARMIGAMVMVEAAVIVIANNANVCKIMRTNPVNTYFSRSSFTLIELLIVLAVLSILSITVILTINPSEFLKQARDSTRLSDMANINSSLNLFVVDSPDASLGTASTTYISIPDPTATSTAGTQCQGLGLSELPSGWTYHCAATSTYRNTDGTGWVPVNFQSMSFGSTLGTLPIDPINTTTSGNYYTYTPGGSWQLTATPESNKVRTTQADQTTGKVGGALSFNGSSNYITLASYPLSDMSVSNSGCAWILTSNISNSNEGGGARGAFDFSPNANSGIRLAQSSGYVYFVYQSGGTTYSQRTNNVV